MQNISELFKQFTRAKTPLDGEVNHAIQNSGFPVHPGCPVVRLLCIRHNSGQGVQTNESRDTFSALSGFMKIVKQIKIKKIDKLK